MLDSALRLAQTGVAVFPVGNDKAPRTPRGFYDATTDEAVIRAWDWDDCMIGAPPPDGVIVVDIDPRNGGDNTLALFPALPATKTAKTRSGGRHVYLSVSPDLKLRGVLGPGIDVKRAGKGYVVIPPSPGYAWIRGGDIAPAPAWLLEELQIEEFDPGVSASPKYFPFQAGSRYGEAAVINARQEMLGVENGARNETLNRVSFGLGQLDAGGEVNPRISIGLLLEAALETGLSEFEARRTIESGWTAGFKVPRQAPERVTA